MKVLVIGAGRMGTVRAEDLATNPKVDQILIANRSPQRAQELATKTGAAAIVWEDMATSGADAVVVTVGTDAHDEVLSRVLPLGLPVLCEKPIALSLAGTKAAINLADKYGSAIQVGFQRRFDSAISATKKAIDAGQVGTLYSIRMLSHDIAPSPREFIAGSGGIFRDLHVHDFDLVSWLTGSQIKSVYATKAVRHHFDYADFDDADVSTISLVTESGVQVSINGARHDALGHDVRLEVFGSKDSLSAGLVGKTPLRNMEGDLPLNLSPYTSFMERFRDAYKQESDAFVEFAAGNTINPCPPQSALESLRVAAACEESIRTNLPVNVSSVDN